MSFNFNGPSFRPMIQESQSMQNNGGGGNTGYFQRGRKKKDKEVKVFGETDEKDSFVPSETEQDSLPKEDNILDKLTEKAKGFVKKITDTPDNTTNKNPFKDIDNE